jgi:hypothetical protein
MFFLLLVLANVAFFAYAQLARDSSGVESQIPLLQISPEKVKLLKTGGARTGSRRGPDGALAAGAPQACVEWGLFAGPEVARSEAAIAKLGLPQALVQRTVADAGGYWVYIPPLKTKADVERKVSELKTFGVPDFFVVQDPPQWRNAISLGIFKSEESAANFLTALRGKGVRSATMERRENFLKQIAYYVRDPTEPMVARLGELQREFPGSEVHAVTCPINIY